MNNERNGFNYEALGNEYSTGRRTDPRIARIIADALGESKTVLNVGAGNGSYEPGDRYVVAVEPSTMMRMRRASDSVPAIAGIAEDLPFDANAFEASMAILTVHHWRDQAKGLAELRRVTSGTIVVMTFDPDADSEFWLADYAPELVEVEARRYGPIRRVIEALGGDAEVIPIPVPKDCKDRFQVALYARPELFLQERVRAAQSAWAHLPDGVEDRIVRAIGDDLESGKWDACYGRLRSRPEINCQLRLIVASS